MIWRAFYGFIWEVLTYLPRDTKATKLIRTFLRISCQFIQGAELNGRCLYVLLMSDGTWRSDPAMVVSLVPIKIPPLSLMRVWINSVCNLCVASSSLKYQSFDLFVIIIHLISGYFDFNCNCILLDSLAICFLWLCIEQHW